VRAGQVAPLAPLAFPSRTAGIIVRTSPDLSRSAGASKELFQTDRMRQSLSSQNQKPSADFVTALGGIFEHAPWVAAAVASRRPFDTLAELFAAMRRSVLESDGERRLDLLRSHPELAGAAARSGNMTAESVAEQGSAGLDRLPSGRVALFEELNRTYREKFGFPFIICVRRHGSDSLLREFQRRVELTPDIERATALDEVFRIAALRLDALVEAPDRLLVSGRLSTHVLDTAHGVPAEGVAVTLVELSEAGERPVASTVTNANGRTDAPLIAERPIPRATYELRFALGDYFRALGAPVADLPFLDLVPIRFGVAEPEGHYHVPLTATPWSYSTYRGS
jgi:2-oxo-4-hydroxy-4-carboxy-5-ureidoimidazoline decarboxylase